MTHPFRFGTTLHMAGSAGGLRDRARQLEALGYDTIHVPDHYNKQLHLIPTMTAIAAWTSQIRVGALVACNDYRGPVEYAKELATIDLISGGRVEWGLGAGWLHQEYESAGIQFDPPGVRVSRLIESVAVMKRLFAGESVDHTGVHYTLAGQQNWPESVQTPHPPLLIGAGGDVMLRHAASEADIVGLQLPWSTKVLFGQPPRAGFVEETERQVELIREAAAQRDVAPQIHAVAQPVRVVDDPRKKAEILAHQSEGHQQSVADIEGCAQILVGSVDELCEELLARRERWGCNYLTVPNAVADGFAPVVERLTGT